MNIFDGSWASERGHVDRTEAIVYYRKDPVWLATSPLAPPELDGPECFVEVHRAKWLRIDDWSDDWREANLERIWTRLQAVNSGDLPQQLGIRSMMVGDLIVVGDWAWSCEMTGWKEVHPDWLTTGNYPSVAGADHAKVE